MRGFVLFLGTVVGCGGADPTSQGKALVAQRACATCHQSPDLADGILSGQTAPQPGTRAYAANLTSDTATGLGGWADIQIVRAMRAGVDNQFMYLCQPMPHFDGSDPAQPEMSDAEAYAIVTYLRSLKAVERVIPRSICAARPGS
jgi:fructose 5-dehydrogenase cytochrome subunit